MTEHPWLRTRRRRSDYGVARPHLKSRRNGPRQGTLTQKLYDLLVAHKGQVVKIPSDFATGSRNKDNKAIPSAAINLRLYYNLDVHCWKDDSGTYYVALLGEQVGTEYVGYTV